MRVVRVANLTVAFLCELAMLAAFAIYGWSLDAALPVRIAAAIALPVAAGLLWAWLLAPRSSRRLRMPWLAVLKVAIYAAAATALVRAGHAGWGIALAIAAAVTLALGILLRQEEIGADVA